MEIFVSVLIGATVGGLSLLLCKSCRTSAWSTLAVGILGALLGMVSNFWIAIFGTPITSSLGAILTLLLWTAAQKLLAATTHSPDHAAIPDYATIEAALDEPASAASTSAPTQQKGAAPSGSTIAST